MGLREALPLIGALGAGSPFWFGMDSGPGERALGGDPRLPGARRAAAAARLGRVPRDARRDPARRRARGPHDGLVGRARCSRGWAPSSCASWTCRPASSEAAGMAALVHALARRAVERAAGRAGAGPGAALVELPRRPRRARRRAAVPRPAAPGARGGARAARRARGEDDALEGVERILREGGPPARQRAIHAEGGMPALLRYLADETARGL